MQCEVGINNFLQKERMMNPDEKKTNQKSKKNSGRRPVAAVWKESAGYGLKGFMTVLGGALAVLVAGGAKKGYDAIFGKGKTKPPAEV